MSEDKVNWVADSRLSWECSRDARTSPEHVQRLQVGCLQRIATSLEKIARAVDEQAEDRRERKRKKEEEQLRLLREASLRIAEAVDRRFDALFGPEFDADLTVDKVWRGMRHFYRSTVFHETMTEAEALTEIACEPEMWNVLAFQGIGPIYEQRWNEKLAERTGAGIHPGIQPQHSNGS